MIGRVYTTCKIHFDVFDHYILTDRAIVKSPLPHLSRMGAWYDTALAPMANVMLSANTVSTELVEDFVPKLPRLSCQCTP
jgi:hypothetical protein